MRDDGQGQDGSPAGDQPAPMPAKGKLAGENKQPQDGKSGRWIKRRLPTTRQKAFVEELKKGSTITAAAAAAGYASPAVTGSIMLKSATVRGLIENGRRRRLDQAASLAVHFTREAVAGRVRLDPTRWAAMRFVMEAAGLAAPAGKTSNDKPLREMSLAELEAMSARIASAKTVAAVPVLDADAVQVTVPAGESTP